MEGNGSDARNVVPKSRECFRGVIILFVFEISERHSEVVLWGTDRLKDGVTCPEGNIHRRKKSKRSL